jgi:hypothetical protein
VVLEQTKQSAAAQGNASSHAVTFDSNVKAGSLLVTWVGAGNRTDWTLTDNRGNAWQKVREGSAGSTRLGQLWFAQNANAGATTITATTAQGAAECALICREFSGALVSGPLDVHMGNSHTASSVQAHTSNATSAPAAGGALVVGLAHTSTVNTYTNLGSFSSLTSVKTAGLNQIAAAHFMVTSPGAQTFSYSTDTFTNSYSAVAVFKATPEEGELPEPPVADFTINPTTAQTGQTVTFDGTASLRAIHYNWDDAVSDTSPVGVNTWPWGTGVTHQRAFQSAGTKYARLRVTDGVGQVHELIKPIVITLAGTSQTVPVGQATETSAAYTVTVIKQPPPSQGEPQTRLLGRATETNQARTVTVTKPGTRLLDRATETNQARTVTVTKASPGTAPPVGFRFENGDLIPIYMQIGG